MHYACTWQNLYVFSCLPRGKTCKFSCFCHVVEVKFCQLVKKWQVLILTLMLVLAAADRLNDHDCQRIQASTLLTIGNHGKANSPGLFQLRVMDKLQACFVGFVSNTKLKTSTINHLCGVLLCVLVFVSIELRHGRRSQSGWSGFGWTTILPH